MNRRESKIPLLLAAIVLGYIVFWGFGYVRTHQAPPAPAPVQVAVQPQPETEAQRVVTTQGAPPPPAQTAAVANNQPAYDASNPPQVDENGVTYIDPKPEIRNRKLAGVTEASGKKG